MPRNVEIKATARDWPSQLQAAAQRAPLAADLRQEDTFFHCPHGRLKLRRIHEGGRATAVLIAYARPDARGPKTSDYHIVDVPDPDALTATLAAALGIRARVTKRRLLYLSGQTRLHFDDVADLGRFLELEVVLRPDQSEADGAAIAQEWMRHLGIAQADLVEGAYADLLPPFSQ